MKQLTKEQQDAIDQALLSLKAVGLTTVLISAGIDDGSNNLLTKQTFCASITTVGAAHVCLLGKLVMEKAANTPVGWNLKV